MDLGNRYHFRPERYEQELTSIIEALGALETIDADALMGVLKKHPKDGCGIFSKSEIIQGVRQFAGRFAFDAHQLVEKVRMKPIRTDSGVAPVTVLTQPYPCPGKCIFCPNDVRMPKSYLSMEPGAQRAAQHRFDPYAQMLSRLRVFHANGHCVDKVELIILGGTWSFYPESYQIWFVRRCFDAMNGFTAGSSVAPDERHVEFLELDDAVDGRDLTRPYNETVSAFLKDRKDGALMFPWEGATWASLDEAQRQNEGAAVRCVGLVVETRPDRISEEEVLRIRRLGATKVQIGYQSLSDEVLKLNKRGHDVATTRRAMRLLRQAAFKIHAHWMPNLYGSSPDHDRADFEKIFSDPDFRPDELKLYPCSLIETAELMQTYEAGLWSPYTEEELMGVLTHCMTRVPPYCRLTRVIRDIPSHDIVVGNKVTNFRQVARKEIDKQGWPMRDIRSREIRGAPVPADSLALDEESYATSIGREVFLQFVTPDDRIVAFLRLSLPQGDSFVPELRGRALIREVHVYGAVVGLGQRSPSKPQHLGLGRRLVERAKDIALECGYAQLAVISAVGTRHYYRHLGFEDGDLYLHIRLGPSLTKPE